MRREGREVRREERGSLVLGNMWPWISMTGSGG